MSMRKVICLILISMISIMLFSATYTEVQTKHLAIQGGYGEAIFVDIIPIASQSQGYITGMPFSIEDALVQYDYNRYGRQVAQWSILSNSDFNIIIEAPDLSWVPNEEYTPAEGKDSLPYLLTFESNISYYSENSNQPSYENKVFAVRSDGAKGTQIPASHEKLSQIYDSNEPFNIFDGESVDYSSYVGSIEGIVYFKFAENADIEAAPGGDYIAQVKITVQ